MEERTRQLSGSERAVFDLPESVGVHEAWIEVDIGDGWRAAFRLVPYRGQPVIGELRVFPADRYPGREPGAWRADVLGVRAGGAAPLRKSLPGRREPVDCPAVRQGITARLLRRIPLGAHLRHAGEFMARLKITHPNMGRDLAAWGFVRPGTTEKEVAPAQRRGGRPDRFYALLAAVYVARIAAGSRRPVADLAARRKLPTAVVRDMIHEARQRDLLTGGRQGAPGGQITARAEKLLRSRRGKK